MPMQTNGDCNFGPFTLRIRDKALVVGDEIVDLGPKSIDVLIYLVANRSVFISRAELIRDVWQASVSDDAVYRQISDIRKKLAEFDDSAEYIETKKGQGWRFIAPVEQRTEAAAQAEAAPVRRKGWSWKVYTAAVAGLAVVAAGAMVKIGGVRDSEPRVTGCRQITSDGFPKAGRVLTDGRLIYFAENVSHDSDSDLRGAAVPVSGGEVQYPPMPVRAGILLDIAARTGDRLILDETHQDAWPILVWRLKEGSLERAGAEFGEGSISPDGRLLAAGHRNLNLYIQDLGTRQIVWDISLQGNGRWPRWSADGKRIRFSVEEAATLSYSLWEVRRDGSGLHQLPIPAVHGKQLRPEGWTADGRYFMYSEYGQLDHHASLWMTADDPLGLKRATPVRLTSAPTNFRSAVVAPDNSAIYAIGTESRNELERFDLKRRAFVPFWEGFSAIDVSFSNDGAWAAFARYPDCTLWISRADGSERRQITWAGIEAHQPHWSPDGRRIAFMGRMAGKLWRIYVVDASGGVPQEVKPDDPIDQGVPSWSADGRSLVFGELRDRKPDSEMMIRVLDLEMGVETVLPGSKGKWSPRWSPDGRTILAQTTDFKELDLFDCQRQTWKPLTRAVAGDATWSLDGKFVHYLANVERGRALFRARIADGKVEELALQPELEYSWAGVAPDGSPLTAHAVKIEEIYALDLKLP